jgi:hypothetical protein
LIKPKLPTDAGAWQQSTLEFDRLSDTLYWDFASGQRPSISHPVTDHILCRVDPATEIVVGLQIDGFLKHAVREFPQLLELADLIGLTPDEVARIRSTISPAARQRAVLRSILDVVSATN